MTHSTDEARKKVTIQHIRDGRTIASLSAEYGVAKAIISNLVKAYREECQTNDEAKSELELLEEVRKLRKQKAELEKENEFLKKQRHPLRRKSINGLSIHPNQL